MNDETKKVQPLFPPPPTFSITAPDGSPTHTMIEEMKKHYGVDDEQLFNGVLEVSHNVLLAALNSGALIMTGGNQAPWPFPLDDYFPLRPVE